ncbi:MAG: SDR family oxidoreductase [Microcella sp.]
MTVLITGGTGTVGRPTVDSLRARDVATRILSRRAGVDHAVGDLRTGTGLAASLDGVSTVVHLATNRRNDLPATRRLIEAMRSSTTGHIIYLSIVGVDAVPLGYYRAKLRCEETIAASGLPFTLLRATQFHEFVAGAFRAQRRLPRTLTLDVPFQPIDTSVVAERLTELAVAGKAAGRVADLGGPEIVPMRELAQQWLVRRGASAEEAKRRTLTVRAPGRVVAAYRAGLHTTGTAGAGPTFAEWSDRHATE